MRSNRGLVTRLPLFFRRLSSMSMLPDAILDFLHFCPFFWDVVAGSTASTAGTSDDVTPSNASTESMTLEQQQEILEDELDNLAAVGRHELGLKEFTGSLGSLKVSEETQVHFMNFFGEKFTTPTASARVACSISQILEHLEDARCSLICPGTLCELAVRLPS
jgi:hypothetical protein